VSSFRSVFFLRAHVDAVFSPLFGFFSYRLCLFNIFWSRFLFPPAVSSVRVGFLLLFPSRFPGLIFFFVSWCLLVVRFLLSLFRQFDLPWGLVPFLLQPIFRCFFPSRSCFFSPPKVFCFFPFDVFSRAVFSGCLCADLSRAVFCILFLPAAIWFCFRISFELYFPSPL